MLAAVVSGLVVARLARYIIYYYRPGGVWGWWWDIGASAPILNFHLSNVFVATWQRESDAPKAPVSMVRSLSSAET